VFGPDLQLTAEGTITNPEASSTLWVQGVFNMEEGGKMNKEDQGDLCHPEVAFV